MGKHRVIAINLPQFHPFKENDEWWGKGFTEWTNVTKAKPRFKGHYQPHLPTETGFYDLRLPEARQMQADMAREAGIYGFCYYHYWFNGHQLMERPVNDILKSGEPDFPFMLCWANENWSRNWDGGFNKVLIKQEYNEEDDIEHMSWLCKNVFVDKRYIRVDNKPVFVIYNPEQIPNLEVSISTWRKTAFKYGFELYLCFMRGQESKRTKILKQGFDAAVEFQPKSTCYNTPLDKLDKWKWLKFKIKDLVPLPRWKYPYSEAWIRDYKDYSIEQSKQILKDYKEFPGITPGWDNSARRVNKPFWMLYNNTPELYGNWLKQIISVFKPYSKDENFIFINAWNEWAEGNHLEPDNKWGRAFLDETKKTIDFYDK